MIKVDYLVLRQIDRWMDNVFRDVSVLLCFICIIDIIGRYLCFLNYKIVNLIILFLLKQNNFKYIK